MLNQHTTVGHHHCDSAHPLNTRPFHECTAGQCNDGLFRLAAEGRLEVLVGQVDRLEAKDVGTPNGEAAAMCFLSQSIGMPCIDRSTLLPCSGEDC